MTLCCVWGLCTLGTHHELTFWWVCTKSCTLLHIYWNWISVLN